MLNHEKFIRDNVLEWLDCINPAACTYDEWCHVGMALQYEGLDWTLWDSWSRRDPARYKDGECKRKWQSFQSDRSHAVTGATLVKMARDSGWDDNATFSATEPFEVLPAKDSLPQVLPQARMLVNPILVEPPDPWQGLEETETFLQALFDREEYVGYCMKARQNGDRYIPADRGTYTRRQRDIVDAIHRFGDVPRALGTYKEEAGAWVRINPLDGTGICNRNVTDYRYVLVESDEQALSTQLELIEKMQLPVAAIVHSGGKSLHAVVHIDAGKDAKLYKERVEYLYNYCLANGLKVDTQNKNPSRLMRLPGVRRQGKKQFLVPFSKTYASYDEWKEAVSHVKDDGLPEIIDLDTYVQDKPPLKPQLIAGILRRGHKMMLAGPSKAGKSFALMELCVALAEGTRWLGRYYCSPGRVLYMNFELDGASCIDRFTKIYDALELPPIHRKNIDIWNLRGYAQPMETLLPHVFSRIREKSYCAIILDPIYKITNGDENSAQDMGKFCNNLDHLATRMNCAVIYCHHYSKGSQSAKKTQDRASGSGVFSRDADAIVDMLDVQSPIGAPPAFRLEMVLREFAAPEPFYLTFEYPLHRIDTTGDIAAWNEDLTALDRGREIACAEHKSVRERTLEKMCEYLDMHLLLGQKITITDVMNELDKSERTVRRYIDVCDKYEINNGVIMLHIK